MQLVKINKQSQLFSAQFKIGQQLCFVYRYYFFNCFYFDNDDVFNDEVKAIAQINSLIAINNRQFDLILNLKPTGNVFIFKHPSYALSSKSGPKAV
jgi:hypothetical protein